VTLEELQKLVQKTPEETLKTIKRLQKEYGSRASGITIYEDEGKWKMGVKTKLLPSVKTAMPKEFPKSLMETLSVIAWKQPITQAFVINIRGNKAYKHIKYLTTKEFVDAKKHKRTLMLRTTQKFADYFGEEEKTIKKMMEQDIQKDIKSQSLSERITEVK